MPKKSGFTLIELLITISIIGILSTIGIVSYLTFSKNARDAKRQSDLKFIQSALEQYHADQIYYPVQLISPLSFGSKTYMTQVPSDPISNTSTPYKYEQRNCNTSGANCASYCLFANMENTPPASDPGCSPSGNYDYGVTRP